MNIWAHRGLCRKYPENTTEAFLAAARYDITGVELDVHLSRDEEIIVIHDETVDRTTDGSGKVSALSLAQIRQLNIDFGGRSLKIPTLREVLSALSGFCFRYGMQINIEFKTNVERHPGIEEKVLAMVREFGLEGFVIYSSFNVESLQRVKELDPDAETGVLDFRPGNCLVMAAQADTKVIHPYLGEIRRPLPLSGYVVRAWCLRQQESFYGENGPNIKHDLKKLRALGITDLITNNCDFYCGLREKKPDLSAEMISGCVDPNTGRTVPDSARIVNFEPVQVAKGMQVRSLREDIDCRLYFYIHNHVFGK